VREEIFAAVVTMIFGILAVPIAFLCLYLAVLTWQQRLLRHTVVLAVIGFIFLGFAVGVGILSYLGYVTFQSVGI
jgi:hypothetical protein